VCESISQITLLILRQGDRENPDRGKVMLKETLRTVWLCLLALSKINAHIEISYFSVKAAPDGHLVTGDGKRETIHFNITEDTICSSQALHPNTHTHAHSLYSGSIASRLCPFQRIHYRCIPV